ncbi:MAG TPA: carbamoyltransferase HypF [Acidimicrobiia bacterium]|nr:carbamoyltransferase HypF [Acidimicrobiia bacterium]
MSAPAGGRVRTRVRVEGIVQGVGFRPFVHGLATRLDLAGFVGNDARGVFVEIEGHDGAVAEFLRALEAEPPPLAVIERVTARAMAPVGEERFTIVASRAGGESQALISPDTATCADCLAELWDETDRRYRYPFTNCTNCGPRFTIVRGVPYDRPVTTMAPFEMCERCAAEYHDPGDRRFHAQPVCCPDCGPRLVLLRRRDGRRHPLPGSGADPLAAAVARLRGGEIVAVKGLGGYHLAVRADDEAAVARLRARKHREEKPFAVMVADLAAASALCVLGAGEAALLEGPRRPIVLAPKREGPGGSGVSPGEIALAPSVAPGNRSLGLMLPYTPLHHLLARDLAVPFVLTSGNISDEPIASADDDAFERLDAIADCFLLHDRAIHIRTDDSVVRSFRDRVFLVRRSRGFAPEPVLLPWAFPRPVLATGAELKNTFCVAKDRRAFVSHHIGDLENYETYASFRDGIEHFGRIFDVAPEVVAHDLHPEYLSTKHAHDLAGVELTGVQHHHAHIASCLADNGEAGPVIGVAFDGLGFGPDGTIWGGEILVADLAGFERVAHLAPVAMPGGAAAIKEPWRMAAAYLDAAFDGAPPAGLPVMTRHEDRWSSVVSLARAGVSAPLTSSAGRLFDAVAALLGVRDAVSYEGQAAIELEQLADPGERDAYRLDIERSEVGAGTDAGGALRLLGAGLVRAVVADQAAGTPTPLIAARFHNGLAAGVSAVCHRLRAERGLDTVALSGGVFQNLLLLQRCVGALEQGGFRVLLHGRVPPNDGGISLGQAAVAGALDRRRSG